MRLSLSDSITLEAIIASGPFATKERPLGRVIGYLFEVDTGNAKPIHSSLRRTSPAERAIVREEIAKMLEMDVIRPSKSPWSSAIVLVTKKDGATRFCVDYRRVNDLTIKDVFPLPRIDDMLAALSGMVMFSTLDAASGYWQVPMHPESISKTAFICTEGLFESSR